MTESESTVHWKLVRNGGAGYRVIAYEGHSSRATKFPYRDCAVTFIKMMSAKPLDKQRQWLHANEGRGSGCRGDGLLPGGRMNTEWARTHKQVRVVGGWRGRPCGGGHVGMNGRNVLARA